MVNKSFIVTILALLASLSLTAQSFTSTSAGLDGVSSVSSVSAVGASSAQQLATTTYDAGGVVCGNTMSADEYNFAGVTADDAGFRDNNSPIGEPFILLAFAALMGGIIAFRRRRA